MILHSTLAMEYPIEDEKLENVERILRERYDSSIRLDGIKSSAGSRQGDNYMSIIKRIFVHGKWKTDDRGETGIKSFSQPWP